MGTTDSYDDKFEDVMHYLTMQLDDEGKRLRVRRPEDLRQLMERFDEIKSKKKGQSPRFSDDFLDRILGTRRARETIGTTIGRRGTVVELQAPTPTRKARTLPPKVQLLQSRGLEVYQYNDRYAIGTYHYSKKNNVIIKKFKDAETGRFISKKQKLTSIDET